MLAWTNVLAMRADLASGRRSQKERTRDALIDAARALLNQGEMPSIVRAAAAARVSQATAYRYYPDPQALLRDALRPRWPEFDALLVEVQLLNDVTDRARRAGEAMAEVVLANRAEASAWLALAYQPNRGTWPAQPRTQRLALVAAVVDPTRNDVDAETADRVAQALAVTIGSEVVLALTAGGASPGEVVAAAGWIAQRIVAPLMKNKKIKDS